ncbi:DUF6438 domain-containing protein [Flavobacterium branchiicola]|uniref:DUF6438 domain-containing protein n=1 Tax=Flavobacterium branchiicola TaxID=1114875 RepID=A0ABV9P6Y4_9FLAO|nr:hypothetical protein [Flavobacterium branchiicola]MBS7252995.1 hypothetical protein [Flavobacterium branchiicola]
MKKIITYLLIVCFINTSTAKTTNKIDNLKTTEDVIKFAKSINPDFAKENVGELQIKPTDIIIKELKNCDLYKSWNIQNWQKIDLNNDGKTDLLFTAYWYSTYSQYAIVETDSNKFTLLSLSHDIDYACKIIKPIVVNNKNELLVNNHKTDIESIETEKTIHFLDTLTYKFDSFIEISNKNTNYDIESIKYISDNNFEIEINKDQDASYNCLDSLSFSNMKGHFFKGQSRKKIDKAYFNTIKKLLEYINVRDLSNEYTLKDAFDFSTVWLEIKFKDGSIKKIKDYGYQGTYGLKAVYDKMTKIAKETKWD